MQTIVERNSMMFLKGSLSEIHLEPTFYKPKIGFLSFYNKIMKLKEGYLS